MLKFDPTAQWLLCQSAGKTLEIYKRRTDAELQKKQQRKQKREREKKKSVKKEEDVVMNDHLMNTAIEGEEEEVISDRMTSHTLIKSSTKISAADFTMVKSGLNVSIPDSTWL